MILLESLKLSTSERESATDTKRALGLGEFPFHDWHKREKENILKAVGARQLSSQKGMTHNKRFL